VVNPDPWSGARKFTAARIALGRAGGSLPTAAWLAFAGDHAAARDAVQASLDVEKLCGELAAFGLPILRLATQAIDRATYLRRPDLGRALASGSELEGYETDRGTGVSPVPDDTRHGREAHATDGHDHPTPSGLVDVALIVADGLSAVAAQRHAASLLAVLIPALKSRGFSIGPISVVTQARVAVQDEIGARLGARVAVILVGERPGLAAADSLGAYLVHDPRVGKTDADRNCVSNIRPGGFDPPAAAGLIAWLVEQAIVRRISGVGLKDERGLPGPFRSQVEVSVSE
jgi:ethanolamine ammonia-lyase small subunit